MSPTTWRGTDDVGGLVLRRFGHLDRFLIRGFDGDDGASAGVKPDLLGGGARQIDHRASAHAVIDQDHDRVAAILHRNPHLAAEGQAAAGGGHCVLVENRTAAGALAVVTGAIPGRHADIARHSVGGHGKQDDDRRNKHPRQATLTKQATLNRHWSDRLP
jgi:hypothetical protein